MGEAFKNMNFQELFMKTIINAVVVGIAAWFSVQSSMRRQVIELQKDVETNAREISRHAEEHDDDMIMIAGRYVEKNVLTPVKDQVVENKNRINENVKEIQLLKAKVD